VPALTPGRGIGGSRQAGWCAGRRWGPFLRSGPRGRPSFPVCRGQRSYCVRTATLVPPRTRRLASLKRAKIRLLAGLKGTTPMPLTKKLKVGAAPALIVVVTLDAGGARQEPVLGFVWQMNTLRGSGFPPVSAVTVMAPLDPTLTVATLKATLPVAPGMTAVSVGVAVAARATMSGVAVFEADIKSVLTPVIGFTGCVLELAKLSGTLTGPNEAVGVMAMTKLCRPPLGMLTGVFGVPMGWFVTGSVI
jgi:hypothetical protein